MKRRSFIFASAAAAIGSNPTLSWAQTTGIPSRVTCLVITDVSSDTSIKKLLTLFDVLWAKGVPFTCVVDPFDKNGQPIQPFHKLSSLLSGYSFQASGLDIASYVPELSNKSAYFQGRSVRDANYAIRKIIASDHGDTVWSAGPRVVACHDTERPTAPSGVRSAGISTVLVLPKADSKVMSELWQNGTVRVYGGKLVDLGAYSETAMEVEQDATQRLLYVSANSLQDLSLEAITAKTTRLATDLLMSEREGETSIQLVSDLPIRDNYRFKRYVSVHIVQPVAHDEAAQKAFRIFRNMLTENGVIYSVGKHAGVFKPDQSRYYWLPTRTEDQTGKFSSSDDVLSAVSCDCQSGTVELLHNSHKTLSPGHTLAFGDLNSATFGFDPCAVLWLSCVDIPDPSTATQISSRLGMVGDVVISVRPEALIHQFARKALLDQLLAMASDGVTSIVSVKAFGQVVVPQGAEIERQRRTIGAMPQIQPRKPTGTKSIRQALLEDAKTAWAYFKQNTNPDTGLCASTYNFSPGATRRLQNVTMWDVGSQINGLVAAVQLGLISKKGFERNTAQILSQIRGRKSQGRLLPQGWLRTDRHKWGTRNFDASDSGRLLSSLQNLKRNSDFDDRLGALVASWDLREVVIDGEIHSVTEGKLHSAYRSHSAHYSARAFRHWGIDARSPYEVFEGRSVYDDQMALLEAASWIGPLGAEPLLLEAMELGMSRESTHLANVLFAAQLEDHNETGRLIAVSEGPTDREPWFTYQGLQLDATKRTWALDTVGQEQKYRTPKFWRDNLMISSKSAFLWAAYRPHPYSDKLVEFVRRNCRTKYGFASGTFNKTGRVTKTYTDLNTNGVILQAIAKMLS